ncbi:MAG: hypothetical protein AAGA30_01905, partial [Planctomycetota bacterium]
MPENAEDLREQQFANLLTQLMDDMASGKELDLEETCLQHTEFADELRELWGTIVVTKAAGSNHSSTMNHESAERPKQALELP